ncbi:protein outspread-like isoform X13 [Procambarus clarkii]|uniref:protein outspread-like isoform X13 n=1 Tax=Procambarus clarkii TaxID=6728 RepID=UPI003742A59A
MSNYKSDCRKFQPNIFNKSKCTNCFRQREEHSAEALESNRVRSGRGKASGRGRYSKIREIMWSPRLRLRPPTPAHTSGSSSSDVSPTAAGSKPLASRKVSKCGYLFVAPDWDFSIPLNRTKRWQRRWFVLYDDGELTYSVDDHPATIPQAVVDMNRVLEVSQAEDVTGNQFSLAITAPDRVTFVKGTCREESRWWMDVLSVFPRTHKQQGRHKRNATFPGIKSTTVLKQSMVHQSPSTTLAPTTFETPIGQRVRFHSCTTDPLGGRPPSAPAMDIDEDVFPTKDSSAPNTSSPPSGQTHTPLYHSTPLSSLPPSTRMLRDEHKENTPPFTEDYTDNPPTSESPPTQDKLSHKFRTRRAIKREARGLTQPRSKSEMSALFPTNSPSSMPALNRGSSSTTGSTTTSPYSSGGTTTTLYSGGNTTSPNSSGGTTTSSYTTTKSTATSSCSSTNCTTTSSYSTPEGSRAMLSPTPPSAVDPLISLEGRGIRRATTPVNSSPSSVSSLNSSMSNSTIGVNSLSTSVGGFGSGGGEGGGGPSSLRSLDSGVHVPTRPQARTAPDKPAGEVTRRQLLTDLEETKREEKLKDIADSITRLRGNSSISYLNSKPGIGDVKPTRECDTQDETEGSPDLSKTPSQDKTDSSHPDHVRGDPDGCGLEVSPPYTASPDLQRVDLPAEDLLYIKKGWLMKQSLSQDWNKYWFVLRGTGLMFYRDPSAEDNGILDGIIDLSVAKSIEECDVARNYGFMIMTWEEKKYVFSAVTSGIRGNWVQALRNAANLKESKDRPLTLGEQIEREIVAKRDRHNSQGSNFESMAAERDQGSDVHNESISSVNSRYAFSSDDEYRTASETSTSSHIQTNEDYFEWDRARSRSNSRSRSSKRSRSSPPSSRRSTRDDYPSVAKDELSVSCFSESGSIHSISDLVDRQQPEKEGSITTLTGSGDAVLVDLLETQVESLKAKLEQTQIKELLDRVEEQEHDLSEKASCANELNEMRKKYNELLEHLSTQSGSVNWKQNFQLLEKKYLKEREEWEEKVSAEEKKFVELTASQNSRHDSIIRRLNRSLQEAEKRIHGLVSELEAERSNMNPQRKTSASLEITGLLQENQELASKLEHLTNELSRMRDSLKSEKSEAYKWKDLVKELRSLLDGKNEEIERKKEEVSISCA